MHDRLNKRQNQHKSSAFTIVELLIVIVVIASLAVLTIVSYRGVQQRAYDSSASSAVSQAKKKLELYKVANGAYPTTGNLAAAGVVDASGTTYQYTSDGSTYCTTAVSGTATFRVTDSTGPATGGCTGHVTGGSPPSSIVDSFDRADSATTMGVTSTGQTWSTTGTLWGIRANKAYKVGSSTASTSAWVEYGVRDMTVTATYVNARQYSTLVARFSPPYSTGSGYRFTADGTSNSTFARRYNGVNTTLYTAPTFSAGATVKITAKEVLSGTYVILYINGAEVFSQLDTAANRPMGTCAGFAQSSTVNEVEFDNFKVEPL